MPTSLHNGPPPNLRVQIPMQTAVKRSSLRHLSSLNGVANGANLKSRTYTEESESPEAMIRPQVPPFPCGSGSEVPMQTSDAGLLERDQMHSSFIISVASTLESTRRSRPRNFGLDLSFEVIITDTRCKEAAIGEIL